MSANHDTEYRKPYDLLMQSDRAIGGYAPQPQAMAQLCLDQLQILRDIRTELRKLNARPLVKSVEVESFGGTSGRMSIEL